MTEIPVNFGIEGTLQGFLTCSEGPRKVPRMGVFLLSGGDLPGLGPNRMYVECARDLSGLGFAALRMDFSGRGDSIIHASRSLIRKREREVLEVQEALGFMEGAGVTEFILVGLCSGADLALKVALSHPKVKGLFLVNGRFVNPATHARLKPAVMRSAMTRFRGAKLFRFSNWMNKLKKILAGKGGSVRMAASRQGQQVEPVSMEKDHEVWMALENTRIPTEIVYSDRSANLDLFRLYHEKFFRKTAGRGIAGLRIIKGADHGFTPVGSQEILKAMLAKWCINLFAGREGR